MAVSFFSILLRVRQNNGLGGVCLGDYDIMAVWHVIRCHLVGHDVAMHAECGSLLRVGMSFHQPILKSRYRNLNQHLAGVSSKYTVPKIGSSPPSS